LDWIYLDLDDPARVVNPTLELPRYCNPPGEP
jgi:hypothetical protein